MILYSCVGARRFIAQLASFGEAQVCGGVCVNVRAGGGVYVYERVRTTKQALISTTPSRPNSFVTYARPPPQHTRIRVRMTYIKFTDTLEVFVHGLDLGMGGAVEG